MLLWSVPKATDSQGLLENISQPRLNHIQIVLSWSQPKAGDWLQVLFTSGARGRGSVPTLRSRRNISEGHPGSDHLLPLPVDRRNTRNPRNLRKLRNLRNTRNPSNLKKLMNLRSPRT